MRVPQPSYSELEAPVSSLLGLQRDVMAQLLRSPALATGDVGKALEEITEAAARLAHVRRASVWRFDDSRRNIECVDLYDAETKTHTRGAILSAERAPMYFKAALEERCIAAHDARTDPRTREFTDAYLVPNDITAMLDAPVIVRGKLVGVVCHEHVGSPRVWHPAEELVAGTLADFVGMALSSAEHARQARELGVLHAGLEKLVEQRTRELVATQESVRALFEASPTALVLTRVKDYTVILGNQRASAMFGLSIDQAKGRSAADFWVHPEERDRVIAAVREKGFTDGVEVELRDASDQNFWALLSATIITFEGEPALLVGVTDITEKKLAEQELRRSEEVQRDLASRDGLTGVYNRRHFMDAASSALALAERRDRRGCVVMIDVDHFKAVNDKHGHAVGDDALRMLTRVCRRECRSTDLVARYGGEEFVLLLPEADDKAARAVAERIRRRVADQTVSVGKEPITITISAGVAERRAGEPLEALLSRADEALYEAKRTGRDRVVVAS